MARKSKEGFQSTQFSFNGLPIERTSLQESLLKSTYHFPRGTVIYPNGSRVGHEIMDDRFQSSRLSTKRGRLFWYVAGKAVTLKNLRGGYWIMQKGTQFLAYASKAKKNYPT